MKDKVLKIIKSPIIYILILCVFFQIKIYKNASNEYTLTPDSYTYYEEYKGGNILKGEIDDFRTPGYPEFIKIIKIFSNEDDLYNNVVIVQKIMFLIEIILIYMTMIKITKNKIISSIISLIVGICPYFVLFNTLILTEALAVFELVLLIFITTLYICKPRKLTAALTGVIILLMIMTRPGYIYMIPIYVLFWVLRYILNKKEIRNAVIGLVSVFITSVLIFMYCIQIKNLYGNFMISSVTYINDLVSIADSKAYTETSESEIKQIMQEVRDDKTDAESCWEVRNRLSNYSYKEKKEFIKEAKYSKKHIKYLVNKLISLGGVQLGIIGYIPLVENSSMDAYLSIVLPITFGMTYLMLVAIACYLIYKLFKYAQIDWFLSMIFIFILANLFTLIVGAPFEPQRLFIVSVIPIIMCIGYMISKIADNNFEIDIENNLFYKYVLEKTENSIIQFLRYIFVGGVAAFVNIGGLFVLSKLFHIHYLLANMISFTCGLITNYYLSKWLVFSTNNTMNKMIEFLSYAIIGIIGLGFDTLFMWIFTEKIAMYFMISKIISTGIVFIWNFVARKILYLVIEKYDKKKLTEG